MINVDYLVLGGGVSGLSFAARLKQSGINDVIVLEKENEVGGLCRSMNIDGSPLDIGGGHFLDMRNSRVLEFLFQFMDLGKWNKFSRISKIDSPYMTIDYPYEANIWQFPIDVQVEYLKSIASAGCNTGQKMPEKFSSWIEWKLGRKIAEDYMLPYNKKIFSMDLDELGSYWLYKLPDVSFEDTLRSCLEHEPAGRLPAHGEFYYPKNHGYGELWLSIGRYLGDSVKTGVTIEQVDFENKTVNGEFRANKIINTVPWHELSGNSDMPASIAVLVSDLRYSGIDVDYHSKSLESDAQWIYVPDIETPHHRKLLRSNFLPGSRGYWTETNSLRNVGNSEFRHTNKYAYPVNTINKPAQIKNVLDWAAVKGVYGLGRWGEWEHMNSDVAVARAIDLAISMINGEGN